MQKIVISPQFSEKQVRHDPEFGVHVARFNPAGRHKSWSQGAAGAAAAALKIAEGQACSKGEELES